MSQPIMLPARLGLLAIGLAVSLSRPSRATASTIVVPDDSTTVTSAIASNADTVLVREGTYAEAPTIERNVVLKGIGVASRPRLNALTLTNRFTDKLVVTGFDISGAVVYTAVRRWGRVEFIDCSMGDLQVNADNYDAHCSLNVSRCRLRSVRGGLNAIYMYADTLDGGGVSLRLWDHTVSIQSCWFRGGGVGAAIDVHREAWGIIAHNRIENYEVGIRAWDDASFTVEGNTITGCGTGMQLESIGESFHVVKNEVRASRGVGIHSACRELSLADNVIVGAAGHGVVAYPNDRVVVQGNVIGDCEGSGIYVAWDAWAYSGGLLRNNTTFRNGRSGLELRWIPAEPFESVSIEDNIGFGNEGWGLSVSGTQFRHGCNDWFGNASGAVTGIAPDKTDLQVDPMFCDVDNADFRLDAASPLVAAPGCGQIGALGVGCGATPTLVQRFTAGRFGGGVRVEWQVAPGATASDVWVERAEGVGGEAWTRPSMERSTDGGSVVELDRTALPDQAYRYRLVALDGRRLIVLDPGVLVPAAARLAFALAEVGPSPSGGSLRIAFTLAHTAAIRIDVFDLLGRRIATPAEGMWPAGTQVVGWDGLTHAGRAAPAGMYVIHYRYPGGTDKRPVVRVP